KVIVPNVGEPWIVTPIHLRSNQTVVFKPGVIILAKKGAFRGTGDCLFKGKDLQNVVIEGYGAIWRMRKKDYMHKPYKKAQWRMGLGLYNCTNVTIEGLTIERSGGDGIYISGNHNKPTTFSKNIVIKDVKCVSNYRNGISVISVDGLLLDNVVMSYTRGHAPQCGIDFEPNNPKQRLNNIKLKNCIVK